MKPVLVVCDDDGDIRSFGQVPSSGPPMPHGRTGRDDQGHFRLPRSTSWEATLKAEQPSLYVFNFQPRQILAQGFLEGSEAFGDHSNSRQTPGPSATSTASRTRSSIGSASRPMVGEAGCLPRAQWS